MRSLLRQLTTIPLMLWRTSIWESCTSKPAAATWLSICTRRPSRSSLIINTRDQTSREWKPVREHPITIFHETQSHPIGFSFLLSPSRKKPLVTIVILSRAIRAIQNEEFIGGRLQSGPLNPRRKCLLKAWTVNSELLKIAGHSNEVSNYRCARHQARSNQIGAGDSRTATTVGRV